MAKMKATTVKLALNLPAAQSVTEHQTAQDMTQGAPATTQKTTQKSTKELAFLKGTVPAVPVVCELVWQRTRECLKKSSYGAMTGQMGTVKLEQCSGRIQELYARYWQELRPSQFAYRIPSQVEKYPLMEFLEDTSQVPTTFEEMVWDERRKVPEYEERTIQVSRKVWVFTGCIEDIVASKCRELGQLIAVIAEAMTRWGVPVLHPVINQVLRQCYGEEATGQYINRILAKSGYYKADMVCGQYVWAKVPADGEVSTFLEDAQKLPVPAGLAAVVYAGQGQEVYGDAGSIDLDAIHTYCPDVAGQWSS